MTTGAQFVETAAPEVSSHSPSIILPAQLKSRAVRVEFLVLSSVVLGAVGQLTLKAALLLLNPRLPTSGGPGSRTQCAVGILIGLSIYALGTWFWIRAVSRASISYLYPLTACSYALVALGGHVLFGEVVHPWRWVGIAVMTIGVTLLALTGDGGAA